MESKNTFIKVFRIVLGLVLIVYSLNQFFHFLPTSYGEMPESTRDFLDTTVDYLPYLYLFEIVVGLFLVFNKWTSFFLIVLIPLSISFLMFTFLNQDFLKALPALLVALLNFVLITYNREKYKPLFD